MTSATTTTTYRVETFQEGDWWVARVAGLDANYTQARTFEEVREMARDLIGLALDIDEAKVAQIVVTENDWRDLRQPGDPDAGKTAWDHSDSRPPRNITPHPPAQLAHQSPRL